jgi:hypothetical protein
MVMFKAKFKPMVPPPSHKPRASSGQQQQQPQPVPPQPQQQERKAPPIEKERGPQYPIKEPGPGNPPERVR